MTLAVTASEADDSVDATGERPEHAPPRLAEGIELFGEYEAGGFIEPKYLLRRADGQVIELPRLLYLVASELDGADDVAQVAERVSAQAGRTVSPANVTFLLEERLRPLGVLRAEDGEVGPLPKSKPVLALGLRAALVPAKVVRAATRPFLFLYRTPVVVAVLAAFVVLDVWLFLLHGVGDRLVGVLVKPSSLAALVPLQIVSGSFHELGHATACRYGGATPGRIGAGIYLVWPVFYSDVTDSYRLGRTGRLRTDLGGAYFNIVLILVLAAAYFATGSELLLVAIVLEQVVLVRQFLPFLRLDGYYVVSDLVGVPDLFGRIRPILASFLPGREPTKAVTELKPRVRVVVTAWVVLSVTAILSGLTLFVVNFPEWFAAVSHNFGLRVVDVRAAVAEGNVVAALYHGARGVLLFLPAVGVAWVIARLVRRGRRRRKRAKPRHGSLGTAVLTTVGGQKRLALTAAQVEGFPFRVRWRGYDRDQVRALLGALARRYSASARQTEGAAAIDTTAIDTTASEEQVASALATQLLGEAEEHAARLRRRAEDEAVAKLDVARQIFEEAAAEAVAMRERADQEAAEVVRAARRQLDLAFELKVEALKKVEADSGRRRG